VSLAHCDQPWDWEQLVVTYPKRVSISSTICRSCLSVWQHVM